LKSPGFLAAVALTLPVLSVGCALDAPEIVVVNATGPSVQLRRVSFSGCAWEGVLAYGEATPVDRCLAGSDRVHFERLDLAAVEDPSQVAHWFPYQTIEPLAAAEGEFHRFEVTLEGLEQDFSVVGPYGH
jgi:hypothetical protein